MRLFSVKHELSHYAVRKEPKVEDFCVARTLRGESAMCVCTVAISMSPAT